MAAIVSSLDAVTVYREGALCLRTLTVPSGSPARVQVGGLPLSLEPASLRARVRGGLNAVLDLRPSFEVTRSAELDVPLAHRQLEEATAKVSALQAERADLENSIAELSGLRPVVYEPKKGEPPRPAPINGLLTLTRFVERRLAGLFEQRRTLDEALRDALADLALRQQRINEASSSLGGARTTLTRAAVITLRTSPTEPLNLELEYAVPGARWVPSYALALEDTLGRGTLSMRAAIAQRTGEDWSNVRLVLSSARLDRRTDAPKLKSMRIGRQQPAPPSAGWRSPPPGLETLFEGYDAVLTKRALPLPPLPAPAPAVTSLALEASRHEPTMVEAAFDEGGPLEGDDFEAEQAESTAAYAEVAAAPMRSRAPGSSGGAASLKKPAPRPMAAPKMARRGDVLGSASMPNAELAAPEPEFGAPPALGPNLSTLDYAGLVLAAADDRSHRGRLKVASERELLVVAGLSVQIDVALALVLEAQQLARSVSSIPLPANAQPVHSVDSFDACFEAKARLEIASTGSWVTVPVTTCEVGLAPELVTVPAVEAAVYRTLALTNRSAHALLPGPVDVSAGDRFLITTQLPAIAPNAARSHRLGLGVEEAVKVARRTQFRESTGGFLGGSTVLPHEVEIELNNRLGHGISIEVRERVPVVDPAEKDLKVEEVSVTPPWERVEGPVDGVVRKGARRWRVTLEAGQRMVLRAEYAVRMPTDRMLVGGNRRA